jgi:hypothetical protein
MDGFTKNVVAYLFCCVASFLSFVVAYCGHPPFFLLSLFSFACSFCILLNSKMNENE